MLWGGGNVTFHGIQVPRERLSLISALHLRASVRYDVVCWQGILACYVRGLPGALLPGGCLINQLAHSS